MSQVGWLLVLLGFLFVVCLALIALLVRNQGLQAPQNVSTMHRLNFELQERGRATLAPNAASNHPVGVVRIALTGGPCAGKSSALTHIIEASKRHGFDCYVGPETATVIMNCGCAVPGTVEGLQIFQSQIFKVQLQMESALTKIATETNRPSIIIFDRGIFDGKAFIPDDVWETVISEYDLDASREEIEEMLLLRYEAVVHMVTAADGAENYYKFGQTIDDSGKPVTRRETAEEARELDAKMWRLWEKHPTHLKITNLGRGFDNKVQHVASEVVRIAKQSIGKLDGDVEMMERNSTVDKKVSALIGRQISSNPRGRNTVTKLLERDSLLGESVVV